jgi:hypothetical protein
MDIIKNPVEAQEINSLTQKKKHKVGPERGVGFCRLDNPQAI